MGYIACENQCFCSLNIQISGVLVVINVIFAKAPPFLGPVSRKSRKRFGPKKPFVKLRPTNSVKLVFSYVVNGIKIKITAKFRASRRLSFEVTKRIMSPEMHPKSFGTFEKQAPGSMMNLISFIFPVVRSCTPETHISGIISLIKTNTFLI